MPFIKEDNEIVGNVIARLLAVEGDWHACAFLANSSRREGGTSEGTKINLDFALGDRVKIGKECGKMANSIKLELADADSSGPLEPAV